MIINKYKIFSILMALILCLQSVAPLPAVIAQEMDDPAPSSLNLDIQIINMNDNLAASEAAASEMYYAEGAADFQVPQQAAPVTEPMFFGNVETASAFQDMAVAPSISENVDIEAGPTLKIIVTTEAVESVDVEWKSAPETEAVENNYEAEVPAGGKSEEPAPAEGVTSSTEQEPAVVPETTEVSDAEEPIPESTVPADVVESDNKTEESAPETEETVSTKEGSGPVSDTESAAVVSFQTSVEQDDPDDASVDAEDTSDNDEYYELIVTHVTVLDPAEDDLPIAEVTEIIDSETGEVIEQEILTIAEADPDVPASDSDSEESAESELPEAEVTETCEGEDCDEDTTCEGEDCTEDTTCEGEDCTEDTTCEGADCTENEDTCEGEACSKVIEEDALYDWGDPDKKTFLELDDLPKDWEMTVDEHGVFHVTYTIPEDTDAEIIDIDLAKVKETLYKFAYATSSRTLEPGDSRLFEIWIQTKSGHTYKYLNGSFILTTPKMDESKIPENEDDQVTGFDGQNLEEDYIGKADNITVSYLVPPILELLLSDANIYKSEMDYLIKYKGRLPSYLSSWLENEAKNQYKTDHGEEAPDFSAAVESLILKYYNDLEEPETAYTDFTDLLTRSDRAYEEVLLPSYTDPAWLELRDTRLPITPNMKYDRFYETIFRFVYGDGTIYEADSSETKIVQKDVEEAAGDIGAQQVTQKGYIYKVLDYDDGTLYETTVPLNLLTTDDYNTVMNVWGNYFDYYDWPDDILVAIGEDGHPLLANGWIPVLGFTRENGDIATASNASADDLISYTTVFPEYDPEWHLKEEWYIKDATVSDFMDLNNEDDKRAMDENSEVWQRADEFFQKLLGSGISEKDASMVSFMMAFNVDGLLADNSYQDTEWDWENEIKLERIDGEVVINKAGEKQTRYLDEDGNVTSTENEQIETISDSETSFQIWTYRENSEGSQEKYYLTQTSEVDDESGETRTNYGFVKYEPDNQQMTYTIDTTGGKLQIDYAMLEGQVYYLQEVVAPEVSGTDGESYDIDTTVYIICDSEEGVEAAKELLDLDDTMEDDVISSYAGSVNSEKPLEINIVNVYETEVTPESGTVTPTSPYDPPTETPTPTPTMVTPTAPTVTPTEPTMTPTPPSYDPTAVTPAVPETPVAPEITGTPVSLITLSDYAVPLAGMINMNEGDCFD